MAEGLGFYFFKPFDVDAGVEMLQLCLTGGCSENCQSCSMQLCTTCSARKPTLTDGQCGLCRRARLCRDCGKPGRKLHKRQCEECETKYKCSRCDKVAPLRNGRFNKYLKMCKKCSQKLARGHVTAASAPNVAASFGPPTRPMPMPMSAQADNSIYGAYEFDPPTRPMPMPMSAQADYSIYEAYEFDPPSPVRAGQLCSAAPASRGMVKREAAAVARDKPSEPDVLVLSQPIVLRRMATAPVYSAIVFRRENGSLAVCLRAEKKVCLMDVFVGITGRYSFKINSRGHSSLTKLIGTLKAPQGAEWKFVDWDAVKNVTAAPLEDDVVDDSGVDQGRSKKKTSRGMKILRKILRLGRSKKGHKEGRS